MEDMRLLIIKETVKNKSICGTIVIGKFNAMTLGIDELGRALFEVSPTSTRIHSISDTEPIPIEIGKRLGIIRLLLKAYYDGYYKTEETYAWID